VSAAKRNAIEQEVEHLHAQLLLLLGLREAKAAVL
jgi:hypothetical protein